MCVCVCVCVCVCEWGGVIGGGDEEKAYLLLFLPLVKGLSPP